LNNKIVKRTDLSDDAIAELEKFDAYDREGTNIPPTPGTSLTETKLVNLGLLKRESMSVAADSPSETKELLRRLHITEEGRRVLRGN
jgi:hypothetical protein